MSRLPGTAREHVGWRTFAYTFIPPTVVFVLVAAAKTVADLPVGELTVEATSVAGLPPYVGSVSALGCFGWAAATGMFFLGACLLYDDLGRRESAFLAASAALTGYLLADDAFTLHEAVLPALGIPEWATYLVIAIAVTAYAYAFRAELRRSAWLFLGIAVVFLGTSVAIDVGWNLVLPDRGYHVEQFLEDATKFFGICAWVAFAALSTRGLVRARLTAGAPTTVGRR